MRRYRGARTNCSLTCGQANPLSRRRGGADGAGGEKNSLGLPDQDIRAMAVYLGSFNETARGKAEQDAWPASLKP